MTNNHSSSCDYPDTCNSIQANLSSGWVRKPLGSFGEIVGGGTPARSNPDFWKGNIPWASVKDFDEDRIDLSDTAEHISEDALANSAATLVPANTPVVCTRMAVGRSALTKHATAINQDVKAFILDSKTDEKYFVRLLQFIGPVLDRISIGSTVRGITLTDLKSLIVQCPSNREEQFRISLFLDEIDQWILLTERTIVKMKLIRAGILHDLLTRGLDENGELRDPIRNPEQFKDSPISPISNSWDALPLDKVASVDRGKFGHRPRNDPALYGGIFPFIQTGDIASAAGEIIVEASQSLNPQGAAVSRQFPAGTIAITIAANIGDTAILGRPMFFPDSIVGVVPLSSHSSRWIEMCLRRAKTRLNALAPQSAQKNINLSFLKPLIIPVPHPSEQQRCSELYESVSSQILIQSNELEKLNAIKSGLMSDLLTGRVRVPQDLELE